MTLLTDPGSADSAPVSYSKGRRLGHQRSGVSEMPALCEGRCDRFVVREYNPARLAWNTVMVVLLLYTATIFPFRLAFLDFQMSGSGLEFSRVDWASLDWIANVLFWVDLAACFFFSYRDEEDREVLDLPKVITHYVTGNFAIDLVASIPPEWIISVLSSANPKVIRLLRLIRLTRLFKLVSFVSSSPFWRWLQTLRGVRLINFTLGFLLIVHLMACGWYLCAALHDRQVETWIGRRMVYKTSDDSTAAVTMPLLDAGSVEQWFHSMYFTLVVFSTVGFGDISATTLGEIVVVCSMMVIGAVVHSILVSRMIHVITNADQENSELAAKRALAVRFAQHVELDEEQQKDLARCIVKSNALESFNQEQVQNLMRSALTETVMMKMHKLMYQGRLVRNRFISVCAGKGSRLPTRFPLHVAAMLQPQLAESGESLYQWRDTAWNMYLVMSGTFAFVALPRSTGGICEVFVSSEQEPAIGAVHAQALYPYLLFGGGTHFGEFEMIVTKPRGSGLRCEAPGQLLSLAKSDFVKLVEDFPDYGALWRDATLRKEGHRKAALKRLTRGRGFRDFAAYTIQVHLARGGKHMDERRRAAVNMGGGLFKAQQDLLPRMSTKQFLEDVAAAAGSSGPGSVASVQPEATGGGGGASGHIEALVMNLKADIGELRQEQRASHASILARLEALSAVSGRSCERRSETPEGGGTVR